MGGPRFLRGPREPKEEPPGARRPWRRRLAEAEWRRRRKGFELDRATTGSRNARNAPRRDQFDPTALGNPDWRKSVRSKSCRGSPPVGPSIEVETLGGSPSGVLENGGREETNGPADKSNEVEFVLGTKSRELNSSGGVDRWTRIILLAEDPSGTRTALSRGSVGSRGATGVRAWNAVGSRRRSRCERPTSEESANLWPLGNGCEGVVSTGAV